MRTRFVIATAAFFLTTGPGAQTRLWGQDQAASQDDPVRTLVTRLDLESYKTTLKGLTQFGDRRQGTQRNRDAVDWIEAQLRSFGCTNTERVTYMYPPELELARIFSAPDVETERSIRFVLWNNEETGLNGSRAYVAQRRELQGIEDPPGSGRYPEPRWLGMVQHDMMLWDHGAPSPDGSVSRDQRPEADVNIEFQSNSELDGESLKMAFMFKAANEVYATDYPAAVGPHMTNTDSTPFMNIVPSISLRENERGAQVGAGWDPNWHQPTDVFTTYTDNDFRLGLNAAQTTLAAIGQLAGATMRH